LQDFYKSCNFYVCFHIRNPLQCQEISKKYRFFKATVLKKQRFLLKKCRKYDKLFITLGQRPVR